MAGQEVGEEWDEWGDAEGSCWRDAEVAPSGRVFPWVPVNTRVIRGPTLRADSLGVNKQSLA